VESTQGIYDRWKAEKAGKKEFTAEDRESLGNYFRVNPLERSHAAPSIDQLVYFALERGIHVVPCDLDRSSINEYGRNLVEEEDKGKISMGTAQGYAIRNKFAAKTAVRHIAPSPSKDVTFLQGRLLLFGTSHFEIGACQPLPPQQDTSIQGWIKSMGHDAVVFCEKNVADIVDERKLNPPQSRPDQTGPATEIIFNPPDEFVFSLWND
jgi:hypothetical protein